MKPIPTAVHHLMARYRAELTAPTADHLHAGDDRELPPRSHPMLARALDHHPVAPIPEARGRTWIWADLHLGHDAVIRYSNRPFPDPEAMSAHFFRVWRESVQPRDLVIVLGDVALHAGLTQENFERIRRMPGRKALVLGNHDLTNSGKVRIHGFDDVYSALYRIGAPSLLLTHVPVPDLLPGWINVHGHWHDKPAQGFSHINVSVEQLDYAPVDFARVDALALACAARRSEGDAAGPTLARIVRREQAVEDEARRLETLRM